MAGPLRDVLVVDAVRTPVGRFRGALADVRPDDLGAVVIAELVRRAGADPAGIDDVIFGCANQAGEDNRNVARMSLLLAGLPVTVPGATVNRLCGSGLQAVIDGVRGDRGRRGRPGRRGRRRVDVARAAGDAQGARGVSARRRDRPRQHARLALREPAHGGAPRHARAGRDRRAGGGAVRRHARGAGRLRARPASGAGPPRTRPGASPTSCAGVGAPARRGRTQGRHRRAPAPRDDRRRAGGAAARLPQAERHGHRGQRVRAQRRRRRGAARVRGRLARLAAGAGRSRASSRPPSPASSPS